MSRQPFSRSQPRGQSMPDQLGVQSRYSQDRTEASDVIRLCADIRGPAPDGHLYQLRILGDETRGYLVAGLSALEGTDDVDFWFPTLEEAQRAVIRFGVEPQAWQQITDGSGVPKM